MTRNQKVHFFNGCDLDCEKTSLKPYIDLFRSFLTAMDKESDAVKRQKRIDEDKKLMF